MRWHYWAGGMLLYLVFLAASAPVESLLWALDRYSPGLVAAEGASGTPWRGEAQRIVITPKGGQAIPLGPLSWQVQPLRLLLGEFSAAVRLEGGVRGKARFSFGARSVSISEIDVSLPAAWIANFQPGIGMWQPGGTLGLRGHDLTLQSGNYSGKGEVSWDQAELKISPVRPLGNYLAEISGAGKIVRFQIQTRSGPLELFGNGTWSTQQGLDFTGSARGKESGLAGLLGMAGRPQPDGSYALRVEGRAGDAL